MKQTFILFLTFLNVGVFFSQQNPTNTSPGGAIPSGQTSNQYWSRAGNTATFGTNNIFGTLWDSPIYTQTDGALRMKLNGTTANYTVNGIPGIAATNSKAGFLLVGPNFGGIYTLRGAYSRFHVTGTNPTQFGYRPWMITGTTYTDNSDLSYFGIRSVDGINDLTEHVITWSNDVNPTQDDMVFRFTNEAGGYNQNINQTNFILANDLDGRHVSRFTATGEMGLGNTFGVNSPSSGGVYVRPKSLAHLSTSVIDTVWMQFTNRDSAINSGTGENDDDGLRIGIIGGDPNVPTTLLGNGTAAIYNQEERPILLSTNQATSTINTQNGNTHERVRIMSVGTPTSVAGLAPAVYNPAGILNTDITRVSISHDPLNPITAPLSLLHLGYGVLNTPGGPNPPLTFGWRPWMDVGMFVASNRSDYVYLGMKNETSNIISDRQDAVLAWGDNPNGTNGPDNLRFIFTSPTTATQSPANTPNGLEISCMVPNLATTLTAPNFGMMGIGDFSPTGPNTAIPNQVNAKLDIDGDLRIRTVTQDNTLNQVLVIDPTDKNRVHYKDLPTFGNVCGAAQNPLFNNREIPMNNNNVIFTDPNAVTSNNRVGIGLSAGNCTPAAKLHVINQNYGTTNVTTRGALVQNFQSTSSISEGLTVQNTPSCFQSYGIVSVTSGGTESNFAVIGDASSSGQYNTGVLGGATLGTVLNTGVSASAQGPAPYNIGVSSFATNNPASNSGYNYGINSQATHGTNAIAGNFSAAQGVNNYGVYAQAPGAPGDYAGYFNGNVLVTGTATVLSDQMFKTDVNEISNALSLVKALNPKRYYLDTIQFNNRMSFSSKLQYGFIAQEVELTNPEIVGKGVHPAKLDSIGQVISPSFDYKTVNYNAIIPINTQAIKELNDKVDKATLSDVSIKTNVQDLSGSLQTILDLRGVSFDWNHSVNQEFQFDSSNHIGFIAQEVQSIEPRLTFNGDNNLLHVDYNKVVPVLVEAIQEQNAIISHQDSMINELNNRLSNLENCINSLNLCNQNQPTQMAQPTTGQTISLNTVQSIVLNQNVPNPFAEQTVITYSIPESVKKADILFYDSNGKLINSIFIKERGNSQLNVFANDLSTGIYTYTLVADGQIVASKKMVKQ
jgi:hypothetical protein